MNPLRVILMCWTALALPAAALTENFDGLPGPGLPAGWSTTNIDWSVRGDALWRKGPGPLSVVTIDRAGSLSNVEVQATVLIRRHEGGNWLIAGVALRQDAKNFWHLALVEAPADKKGNHYLELLQCLDGVRNAQSEGAHKLVRTLREGETFSWEFNHAYRLRLRLGSGRIEGALSEMDGTVRTRIVYALKEPVVRGGVPALCGANVTAVFDDIVVERLDQTVP